MSVNIVNDEYEFYFSNSINDKQAQKLLSELELRNSYISIKNKSILTHKNIESHLLVVKFIDPLGYGRPRNYINKTINFENITKLIYSIVNEFTKRASIHKDKAPIEIIFYTIRDINPALVKNIALIDMCAITKDIVIDDLGVNTDTITKYNISKPTHKILNLVAELNTLIKNTQREYLIDYHITHKVDAYEPQWYNFTSTIQKKCIQYCIDKINETITKYPIE